MKKSRKNLLLVLELIVALLAIITIVPLSYLGKVLPLPEAVYKVEGLCRYVIFALCALLVSLIALFARRGAKKRTGYVTFPFHKAVIFPLVSYTFALCGYLLFYVYHSIIFDEQAGQFTAYGLVAGIIILLLFYGLLARVIYKKGKKFIPFLFNVILLAMFVASIVVAIENKEYFYEINKITYYFYFALGVIGGLVLINYIILVIGLNKDCKLEAKKVEILEEVAEVKASEAKEEVIETTEEKALVKEEVIEATEEKAEVKASEAKEEVIETIEEKAETKEEVIETTEEKVEAKAEVIETTEEKTEVKEEVIETTEEKSEVKASEAKEEVIEATEEKAEVKASEAKEEVIETTEEKVETKEEATETVKPVKERKQIKPTPQALLKYLQSNFEDIMIVVDQDGVSFKASRKKKMFINLKVGTNDYRITFQRKPISITKLIVKYPSITKAKTPAGDQWFKLVNKGEFTEADLHNIIKGSYNFLVDEEAKEALRKQKEKEKEAEKRKKEKEKAKLAAAKKKA